MIDKNIAPGLLPTVPAGGAAPRQAIHPDPAGAAATVAPGDQSTAGLEAISGQIAAYYGTMDRSLKAGDYDRAKVLLGELNKLTATGLQLSANSPYHASFERVRANLQLFDVQLSAAIAMATPPFIPMPTAPHTQPQPTAAGQPAPPAAHTETKKQLMMVGLPGHGGRVIEVETHETEHKGPLGLLGTMADGLGHGLEMAGHAVFLPLELAGKVLDPVRSGVGSVLSSVRGGIDNSLGKIPILGAGVRFTTGLANSVVGLVDGAVQGVTHPVELIKGVGSMAYSITSLVPPVMLARMAWDAGVNGKGPVESYKGVLSENGAIVSGFFHNAIEDVKAGNYAGALGQVTGDIGSFFVGGAGAAGAAGKVAATGGKIAELAKASKIGKLAEAAKASKVGAGAARMVEAARASQVGADAAKVLNAAKATETGAKVAKALEAGNLSARAGQAVELGSKAIHMGVETSGKIFSLGLRGNFAAWNKVGKAISGLPGMEKVTTLGSETAARLRTQVMSRATAYANRAEEARGGAKPPVPEPTVNGASQANHSAAGVVDVNQGAAAAAPAAGKAKVEFDLKLVKGEMRAPALPPTTPHIEQVFADLHESKLNGQMLTKIEEDAKSRLKSLDREERARGDGTGGYKLAEKAAARRDIEMVEQIRASGQPSQEFLSRVDKEVRKRFDGLQENAKRNVQAALQENVGKVLNDPRLMDLEPSSFRAEVARRFDALPQNSPERLALGKAIVTSVQEGMGKGLGFEAAPMSFETLEAHASARTTSTRVALDPSLLNEKFDYLMQVVAEEQTHAFQHHLAAHPEIPVPRALQGTVNGFRRGLQEGNYIHPPSKGLEDANKAAKNYSVTTLSTMLNAPLNLLAEPTKAAERLQKFGMDGERESFKIGQGLREAAKAGEVDAAAIQKLSPEFRAAQNQFYRYKELFLEIDNGNLAGYLAEQLPEFLRDASGKHPLGYGLPAAEQAAVLRQALAKAIEGPGGAQEVYAAKLQELRAMVPKYDEALANYRDQPVEQYAQAVAKKVAEK